ncbi:MAG: glycosyl transferase family 2 [Acidobacteriaceae bacterium]|nr:glycosyl transferase family 2 [Acidobacteriaceae bacterium]
MSTTFNPKISVIISTRDRLESLEACVRGVSAQSYRNFDVLIVDSAPQFHSAEELAQRYKIAYSRLDTPGLTIARNHGARLVSGDLIAFTDDDAVPEADWLTAIARAYKATLAAAITGPVLPLTGNQEDERRWVQAGGTGPGELVPVNFTLQTPKAFCLANTGAIGSGANVSFNRKVFFEVLGGFDERLGVGGTIVAGEEGVAFWKLLRKGWTIHYTPEAVVRHPIPDTPDASRRRYIRGIVETACYITLIAVESPSDWLNVLKLIFAKLTGWQPNWRLRFADNNSHRPLSTWRAIPYWIVGFLAYWRARFRPLNHSRSNSNARTAQTSGVRERR